MSDALREFEMGCLMPLLMICLIGLFGSAAILCVGFIGHWLGWWDMSAMEV